MSVNAKEIKKNNRDKDAAIVSITAKSQDRQSLSSEDLDLNELRQSLLEAQKNAESAKATVTEVLTNIYSEKHIQDKNSEDLAGTSDNTIESNIEQPTSTGPSPSSYEDDGENHHNQPSPEKTDNIKRSLWHRILGNNGDSMDSISEIKPSVLINKLTDPDIKKELDNLTTRQNKQLHQLIDNAIEEQSQKKIIKIVEKAKSEIAAAQIIVKQAKREVDDVRKQLNVAKEETRRAKGAAEEAMHIARKQLQSSREEMEKLRMETEEVIRLAEENIKRAQEEADAEKQAAKIMVDQSKQDIMSHMAEEIKAAKEEARVAREAAEQARAQADKEAYCYFQDEIGRLIEQVESTKNEALEIIARSREESKLTKDEAEKTDKTSKIAMDGLHPETALNRVRETGTSSSKSGEDDTGYIAAMLHEMRAPLHSISSFARLMLEDDVPDTMTWRESLSFLVQQSDTLNGLLDDLAGNLANSSSHLEINRTIVSPNELISDVIRSMQNIALEKNILIGSTIPDRLPAIDADESRIKQVLINLIDNALKFNEGDSTVIIKAQVFENELMILVEDYGIGIPEGETLAVFDDYYRASNHGDREGQGLGLGVCKQIVEAHGSSIHVKSVEGECSTFYFTLPITVNQPQTEAPKTNSCS